MATQTIVGIGTKEAQDVFLAKNQLFLAEYHRLRPVVETVFLNRVIQPPSDADIDSVAGLPDDDPKVLAIDDKYKSDLIVFTLGRIALDDFGEMIVLAGNGWGVGALKIVRGMYERCVTAAYIAKTPIASRAFADNLWTHRAKVWRRLVQLNPALGEGDSPAEVKRVQGEARRVQALKNESICKCCLQVKSLTNGRLSIWRQWPESQGNRLKTSIYPAIWSQLRTCTPRGRGQQRGWSTPATHGPTRSTRRKMPN